MTMPRRISPERKSRATCVSVGVKPCEHIWEMRATTCVSTTSANFDGTAGGARTALAPLTKSGRGTTTDSAVESRRKPSKKLWDPMLEARFFFFFFEPPVGCGARSALPGSFESLLPASPASTRSAHAARSRRIFSPTTTVVARRDTARPSL